MEYTGSLRIIGKEISELSVNEVRNNIEYTPSNCTVFSGSLYDNLQGNNITPENEQLLKELIDSRIISQLISNLGEGLGSIILEDGTNLSEGQRQTISFCRTLLFNKSVLIFDESTSQIDRKTEIKLLEFLFSKMSNATLIFTDHNEYVRKRCRKIIQIQINNQEVSILLKKFIYITLGVSTIIILSSCTIKASNDKQTKSSYDGEYLSFNSIVENKKDPLFTIKDGKIQGESLQGEIDEISKKITSEKESYHFLYSKGEMTILDKKEKVLLTGYRKNTQSYTSVDEIYGEYERVIVPKLKIIIETNVNKLVLGEYTRVDAESIVKNIIINKNDLRADFIGESTNAKNEKLTLKNINIEQPLWDVDVNSNINIKILNQYSKIDDLEKVVKNIDFSLVFNINDLEEEYMSINYNSEQENEYLIKVKSISILGDQLVDDVYNK